MEPIIKRPGLYKITAWLFDQAEGHYDIDLGESGVSPQEMSIFSEADMMSHLNYSMDKGSPELVTQIARLYGVSTDKVAVTHGAQEALYLFYRSYLSPNDHVITFTPGWQQSWEIPEAIGCDVSKIPMQADNYSFPMGAFENCLRKDTRLVILNYPHNPTGQVLSKQEWEAIFLMCKKNNTLILNDEDYVYDYSDSIVNRYPNSISVSSLSKVFGFPGFRIGWFVGNKQIVENVVNYRRYTTVCNSSLCEHLAAKILSEKTPHLQRYQQFIKQGKDLLCKWVETHSQDLTLIPGSETPYAYLKFKKTINAMKFCQQLLNDYRVLVMPAETFDDSQSIRVTYARDRDTLTEGLQRISTLLNRHVVS